MKRSAIHQQMEFAPKLAMHGEDGPVDIADKTVSKNDVRDLPVATATDIRQRIHLVKFGLNYRFGAGPVVANY